MGAKVSGMVNLYVFFGGVISVLTSFGFTIALVHTPLVLIIFSGVRK